MFLKASYSNCPLELQDLYLGASVNVFGRQLKIVDYGDDFTKKNLSNQLEKTLGLIKPDTISRMGEIIDAIDKHGLIISKMRLCQLKQNDAYKFYEEHAGKSFFNDLISYVTSGPVLAFELVGENAVQKWRDLIGPTDPSKARSECASSLRARFGTDVTKNGFHGSDSATSASRELASFFPNGRQGFANCVQGTDCTCCIIKPHAVKAGLAGQIICAIQDAGFTVNTIQLFNIEKANVEEFLEVYKGVVHEYPDMVQEFCSGPVIALEITSKENIAVPAAFRETCGPADPEIARHLRPRTLRAKFGKSKIQNAVHCTDLPEDAALEVEYFFKILDRPC